MVLNGKAECINYTTQTQFDQVLVSGPKTTQHLLQHKHSLLNT